VMLLFQHALSACRDESKCGRWPRCPWGSREVSRTNRGRDMGCAWHQDEHHIRCCTICQHGYHSSGGNCRKNICSCSSAGTAARGTACPSNGMKKCISCKTGYHLDGGQCAPNQCSCTYGTGARGTACASNGMKKCASCKTGFHLDGSSCKGNRCKCAGGFGGFGSWDKCPADGSELCIQCLRGYHLDAKGTACIINQCVCSNGTATLGVHCPKHGTEKCMPPCEILNSNKLPWPKCKCLAGFTGQVRRQKGNVVGECYKGLPPKERFQWCLLFYPGGLVPFLGLASLAWMNKPQRNAPSVQQLQTLRDASQRSFGEAAFGDGRSGCSQVLCIGCLVSPSIFAFLTFLRSPGEADASGAMAMQLNVEQALKTAGIALVFSCVVLIKVWRAFGNYAGAAFVSFEITWISVLISQIGLLALGFFSTIMSTDIDKFGGLVGGFAILILIKIWSAITIYWQVAPLVCARVNRNDAEWWHWTVSVEPLLGLVALGKEPPRSFFIQQPPVPYGCTHTRQTANWRTGQTAQPPATLTAVVPPTG